MSTCPNITNKILHIKFSTPFISKLNDNSKLRFIANNNPMHNLGINIYFKMIYVINLIKLLVFLILHIWGHIIIGV